jgi:hypothetical protein
VIFNGVAFRCQGPGFISHQARRATYVIQLLLVDLASSSQKSTGRMLRQDWTDNGVTATSAAYECRALRVDIAPNTKGPE